MNERKSLNVKKIKFSIWQLKQTNKQTIDKLKTFSFCTLFKCENLIPTTTTTTATTSNADDDETNFIRTKLIESKLKIVDHP